MPGTTIPRGNILNTMQFALTLSPAPAQVAGALTAEQSFTIPGLQVGDYLACQCASAQTAGISVANVRVTAANTATLAFNNSTAGPLTPVAGVYGFIWGRPENLPLPTSPS
jgi:hypothetical protein